MSANRDEARPLLSTRGLAVTIETGRGPARVVDGVDLDLWPGESVAVVGESGCGKTMLLLSLMGLVPRPPALAVEGSILLEDRELIRLPEKSLRRLRGRKIGMIFQEPMSALNPVLRVGEQVAEVFREHAGLSGAAAREAAAEALRRVGLPQASRRARSYPHELSGGMRQRVVIAMALALDPPLVLADEPTTALDVTIQAQILALLRRRVREHGASLLLVTHDLAVVGENCSRALVMYAGRVVESGPVEDIWKDALHPYTQGLLASLPKPRTGPERPPLTPIPGTPPRAGAAPGGCAFHPRCPQAMPRCAEEAPPFTRCDERGVRCWLRETVVA